MLCQEVFWLESYFKIVPILVGSSCSFNKETYFVMQCLCFPRTLRPRQSKNRFQLILSGLLIPLVRNDNGLVSTDDFEDSLVSTNGTDSCLQS